MNKWETLSSTQMLESPWVKVHKDAVRLTNGVEIDDFYTITISHAAAIIALDENQNIILKREYRYCYDRELIEIPAGAFNDDEVDPLNVAKRELLEETGYASSSWQYLGATVDSSAKLTNYMHIYYAADCRKIADQKLDPTEQLDVMVIPFRKAVDMIMSNEICCNSSSAGILKVARLLNI